MTIHVHLAREIVDRVVAARDAKETIDVDANAIELARSYPQSGKSVEDLRDEIEFAAAANGAQTMRGNIQS